MIYRLSVSPFATEAGTSERTVRVEHRSDPTLVRVVSWAEVSQETLDECSRIGRTLGTNDLTEWAAIGMMDLLIHNLEGSSVLGVVEQGGGGDYWISFESGEPSAQIEVSGILDDPTGAAIRSRVREKREQLLKMRHSGFVSVTAFGYKGSSEILSVLDFVEREADRDPVA